MPAGRWARYADLRRTRLHARSVPRTHGLGGRQTVVGGRWSTVSVVGGRWSVDSDEIARYSSNCKAAHMNSLDHITLPHYLIGSSALDRYFRRTPGRNQYALVVGDLVELARGASAVTYPGLDDWDAAIHTGSGSLYLRCVDSIETVPWHPLPVMNFLYNAHERSFVDRFGVYRKLRDSALAPSDLPERAEVTDSTILDAAVLAARHGYHVPRSLHAERSWRLQLTAEHARMLWIDIVTGAAPWLGLQLLMESGFIEHYWPKLAQMNATPHAKEFHPEGNVWQHSLETLRYRKAYGALLSSALLLHDCGKPFAERTAQRAFDSHAEIGAAIARDFLAGLGFPREFTEDVWFLIRHHMLPGLVSQLPVFRTQHVMRSRLFPLLLELYRCDLSSTYRGPDGYYRACRTYRAFLKNTENPFRTPEGRKLVQLYVE